MKPDEHDNAQQETPRVQTPAGQCLAAGAPCGIAGGVTENTEAEGESKDVSN